MLLISTLGCGYNQPAVPEGYTRVQLQPSGLNLLESAFAALAGPLDGGVFVHARRLDGTFTTNFRLSNDSTIGNFTLPNGTYHFFAFGFPTLGLSGPVHCGNAGTLDLLGGTVTVNLYVNQSGCSALPFNNPAFTSAGLPKSLGIRLCPPGASVGQFGSVVNDGSSCSGGTFSVMSLGIKFPIFVSTIGTTGYTEFPVSNPPEVSRCILVSGNDAVTPLQLPYGDAATGSMTMIPTQVALFTDSTCSGTPVWGFDFPAGLANSTVRRVDGTFAPAGGGPAAAKIYPGPAATGRLFLLN